MTGPLLVVLHLIPHGVLAGLFFVMGVQALEANGITAKLVFLLRDEVLTPPNEPLRKIKRRSALWLFVMIELVGFGATFAITQTVAAVGFPIFIFLLIPLRALVLPHIFHPEELDLLDAPTASDFTMEGIGGSWDGKLTPPEPSGDETTVSSRESSRTPSRRHSFVRDGLFASPGNPRKSQEHLAEMGDMQSGQSTATRRLSVDRRSTNIRRGSSSCET
jgi:hypothetical protein